jgi:hypothetical protein
MLVMAGEIMSNNSPATLYTVPPMTVTEALRKLESAYTRQGIELEMARTALNEWFEKTNWVQEQMGSFPINALGKHRADVMREEIERLREASRIYAEPDTLTAVLPGVTYMNPPDGGSVTFVEQFARMAKDAERYRWLRDNALSDDQTGTTSPYVIVGQTMTPIESTRLDKAIDIARGK